MSSEDIESGTRWFASVGSELQSSNFGLFCLTRRNLSAPWLHFEAGAISKTIDHSNVVPMLFRLRPSDISGPLTQFQAATFQEEEVLRVLKSINKAAGEEALDEARLQRVFTSMWGQFYINISNISEEGEDDPQGISLVSDNNSAKALEELLVLAREQSVSQTVFFKYISKTLEQTAELRGYLEWPALYISDRHLLDNLGRRWNRFLAAWIKFQRYLKSADSGILESQEMLRMGTAIIPLANTVKVLMDPTRRLTAAKVARELRPAKEQQDALEAVFERPPSEPDEELIEQDKE
jgi:hypothetical protein